MPINAELGNLLDPDVAALFVAITRFEAALIASGYVEGHTDKAAGVAWGSFTTEMNRIRFFEEIKDNEDIAILCDKTTAPRRLVRTGKSTVEWRAFPDRITEEAKLFEAVRTVRNNLFHGGKIRIRQRDRALVHAAMSVLAAAYEACHSDVGLAVVARNFDELDLAPEHEAGG